MAEFAESFFVSLPVVIIIVEVGLASPLGRLIQTLLIKGRKSVRLLSSRRISDHWKERVLLAYALTILQTSILILAWLISLFLIFTFGIYIGTSIFSDEFEGISVLGRSDYLLSSFLIAVVYLVARRFVRNV